MVASENYSGVECGRLFGIAERENNAKRKNLIVNRYQAKHVPAVPADTLALFDRLAERIDINGESTAVIGFAETATAIAARIAIRIGAKVLMQTTRENYPDEMNVAEFSEEHSHATEQKLCSAKGGSIFDGITDIIFVDDELTTGKTILNFIDAVRKHVPDGCRFYAASIINGMNSESMAVFKSRNIGLFYLIKTDNSIGELNTQLDIAKKDDMAPVCRPEEILSEGVINGGIDPRLGCSPKEYETICNEFAELCADMIELSESAYVHVIGTEEFMYPAIMLAERLCSAGMKAVSHSTTRSPIIPAEGENYPLHSRAVFGSIYEPERKVHLYELDCDKKWDAAVIVTDAEDPDRDALMRMLSFINAEKIYFIRWKNGDTDL